MSAVAMVTRTPEREGGGGEGEAGEKMKMTSVDVEKMKKRRGRSRDSETDENRNMDDDAARGKEGEEAALHFELVYGKLFCLEKKNPLYFLPPLCLSPLSPSSLHPSLHSFSSSL